MSRYWLVDWTSKVWLPTVTSGIVTGEVHGANSAPSYEHMNVTAVWSAENVNVALVAVVVPGSSGTSAVIVVSAAPTTVQVNSAGVASTLRVGSTARTRSVCSPGSSPLNSARLSGGAAQDSKTGTAVGSSAHSNDAPGSLLENVKVDTSSE